MTTFVVNTPLDVVDPRDDLLSLREAIKRAELWSAPTTIEFSPELDFVPIQIRATGKPEDEGLSGDLDIRSGSVIIHGSGPSQTVIQPADNSSGRERLIHLFGDARLTIRDATLRGGVDDFGAGIAVETNGDGQLTLQNVRLRENHAQSNGGGLYIGTTSRVEFISGSLENNQATNGGGVANLGSLTLFETTVDSNVAVESGGGLHNQNAGANTLLQRTTFHQNRAKDGAAIANTDGIVDISHSTISRNFAAGKGAGILTLGASDEGSTQTSLSHLTVTQNETFGGTGVIHAEALTATTKVVVEADYSIFVANPGGPIPNAKLPFRSTSGSTNGPSGSDIVWQSLGHNLFDDQGARFELGIEHPSDLIDVTQTIVEPTLRDNGGGVATHALVHGSLAINAGERESASGQFTRPQSVTIQNGTADDGLALIDSDATNLVDLESAGPGKSVIADLSFQHGELDCADPGFFEWFADFHFLDAGPIGEVLVWRHQGTEVLEFHVCGSYDGGATFSRLTTHILPDAEEFSPVSVIPLPPNVGLDVIRLHPRRPLSSSMPVIPEVLFSQFDTDARSVERIDDLVDIGAYEVDQPSWEFQDVLVPEGSSTTIVADVSVLSSSDFRAIGSVSADIVPRQPFVQVNKDLAFDDHRIQQDVSEANTSSLRLETSVNTHQDGLVESAIEKFVFDIVSDSDELRSSSRNGFAISVLESEQATLSIDSPRIRIDEGEARFRVSLDTPLDSLLQISASTRDGTGFAGQHYTPLRGSIFQIPAGEQFVDVPVELLLGPETTATVGVNSVDFLLDVVPVGPSQDRVRVRSNNLSIPKHTDLGVVGGHAVDNGSGDLVYWLAGRQDEGGGLFVISPDSTTPIRLDAIDRDDVEILDAELTGEGRFVQYQVRWHDSGDEFTFRVPVDGGLSVLMPSNDSNDELQLESAIQTRPNGQFFLARADFSVDIGLYFDAVGSTIPPIELTTRVLGTQSEVQDFVVSNDGQQVLVSLRSGGSQSGQAKILAIDVADLESRFVYSEPGPRYGLDSRFTLEPASNDVITEISWRENGERSIRLYRTHFNGAISPITFPELAGLQITDVDLSPDQKSARVSVLIDDSLVRTYVADLLSGQVVPIRAKDFSWAITTEGRYLIDWGALLAVKKVHLDSLEVEVEPSLSRQHSHADDLFAWKIAADQSTILIFDSSGRGNTLGAKAIDVHSGESVVLDVSIHRDLYEQIDQAVLSPDGEYLFVITRGHSLGESLVRAVPTSGAPSTVIGSWDVRDPLSKKVRFASDHRFSFLERSKDDVRWVDRFDRATQTVERFPLGRTQTRHLFPTQVRTSFGTRGNFAFFSSSGVLHRRNLDTGVDQIVYSPATSSDSITDYRVSPDNRWLIIHTFDRRLLFFETDTTTAASIEEATLSEVAHWDFAEGGKSLVVATDEFNARLGRVGLAAQTGVPTVEWLTRTDQFDRVTSLQVAPDSLQMVVGVSSQAPERLSGIYHLSIQSGQLVRLADSVNLFEASTQRFVITPDSRALLLRDESSTRPGFFIVPLDGSAWIRVDDELASGERVRLASSRNFTRQFVEGGRAMLAQGDDNELFRISLTGESPRLILQTKETRDPVVIGGGSSVVLYNPSQTSAIELFERVPLSERSEIGAARSGEAIIRGSALFTGDGRYAIVYRQGQIVVRNFDAMTTMAHQVYDPSYEHIELIGFDASDDSVIFAVAESRNSGFRLMRLDVSSTQTHTQIVARGARRWDDYHYENFPHQIVHQLSPFESSSVITAWGVTGVATIAVGESESFTISSDDNVTSVTGLPGITRIEIKGEANATVKLRSVAWHTPAEAVTLALAGHHSVFDLTDAKIEPANSNLTVDLRDASRSVLHFDSSVLASFVSGNGPHVLLGHGDRVRPVHAENWRIRHVTIPEDASLSTYVLSEKASDRAFLVHSPLRFTNPVVPEDVDGNGHVTAIDALRVINALNQSGDDRPIELALTRLQEGLVALVDVDGNGRLSSIDALRVINELNRAQLTTPSSEPVAWAGAVDSVFEDDNDDLLDEAIGLMF